MATKITVREADDWLEIVKETDDVVESLYCGHGGNDLDVATLLQDLGHDVEYQWVDDPEEF